MALFGIGGAMAGLPFLDPVAGLCVSLMIARTGLGIGADAVRKLTDAVDEALLVRVRGAAGAVAGVRAATHVRARWSGSEPVMILQRTFVD